jgi:hypothetical protein
MINDVAFLIRVLASFEMSVEYSYEVLYVPICPASPVMAMVTLPPVLPVTVTLALVCVKVQAAIHVINNFLNMDNLVGFVNNFSSHAGDIKYKMIV